MWQVILFFYTPIVVTSYALYDKVALKDLGLYMTMLAAFLIVSFMYCALHYSPGVIVRNEGDPQPSAKQNISKWFREQFFVYISLVFVFELMVLIAWNLAKGFQ